MWSLTWDMPRSARARGTGAQPQRILPAAATAPAALTHSKHGQLHPAGLSAVPSSKEQREGGDKGLSYNVGQAEPKEKAAGRLVGQEGGITFLRGRE